MDSTGSVLFLHVGKGGVQFGSAFWELLALEHGLSTDGKFERQNVFSEPSGPLSAANSKLETFYMEGPQGRQVPRALFLDLDTASIDGIRKKHPVLNPSQLMSWKEDTSSNFASGYYTKGANCLDMTMHRILNLVEASDKLQGFVLSRTLGGGTGSGFGSLLLEKLTETYPKATKISLDMIPSLKLSSTINEPYNVALSTHASMEHSDVTFLFENDALYDLCQHHWKIKEPKTANLDSVMAQIMSAVTCSIHIEGSLNKSLAELKTNLVPYPRLHFPLISYAPIAPPDPYQQRSSDPSTTFDVLLMEVLSRRNQVIKTYDQGAEIRNMAINFLYRGQMTTSDANSIDSTLVSNSKSYGNQLRFARWVPLKELKAGVCPLKSVLISKAGTYARTNALVLMRNTTSVDTAFKKMYQRFEDLFSRKSYLHWYINEGMQMSEFVDAREDILGLIREYHECEKGEDLSRRASRKAQLKSGSKLQNSSSTHPS